MDSLRFFGDILVHHWRTGHIVISFQDIHMLSISDFLVCTFSSQVNQQNARFLKLIIKLNVMAQVCRIAYELMQQHHVDASDRFKSLDDIW